MILITGGSGQLGTSLRRLLAGTDYLAPTHTQLDITKSEQVQEFFRIFRPDAVLHCAAFNDVDLAEEEREKCCDVNVVGTRNIADASRNNGSYMIYTSSDYVFDGTKDEEYGIEDKKHPLSVYGMTKSEAEDIVLAENRNAVVRISWLFGMGQHNFVQSILQAAQAKKRLTVVNDQIGSPTYTEDLAVLLCEMLGQKVSGLFHATNEGFCSRADFAKKILCFAHSDTEVLGIPTSQYPTKAQRPLNSCLSKSSLDVAGLHRLPDWEDAVARYLAAKLSL